MSILSPSSRLWRQLYTVSYSHSDFSLYIRPRTFYSHSSALSTVNTCSCNVSLLPFTLLDYSFTVWHSFLTFINPSLPCTSCIRHHLFLLLTTSLRPLYSTPCLDFVSGLSDLKQGILSLWVISTLGIVSGHLPKVLCTRRELCF